MAPTVKLVEIGYYNYKYPANQLKSSRLEIGISGADVTTAVVNALRRAALNDVPTYAFYRDQISIDKNTSVFDNDYMRLRIEQLTVPELEVSALHLEPKYCEEANYKDVNREKHPDDKKLVVVTANKTNRTDTVMSVTSNDFKYYEDNELKKKFSTQYPLLLIKLRPGDSFSFSATAVLGCGRRNNIWAAAANAYFEQDKDEDEDNPHKFVLTLESQGQLDEYTVLDRCCTTIINQLQNISNRFDANIQKKEGSYLEVLMPQTSHTVTVILNEIIQSNTNTKYSGLAKPDLLQDSMLIKLISSKGDPETLFLDGVNHTVELFKTIHKEVGKLMKK